MSGFVVVGKTSEVPEGQMKLFVVNGFAVAVANVGGKFHAFQDECTHQTCSLAEGDLEGGTVVCLCHNAEFDVSSGEPLAGPATRPVPIFETQVEGDDLQVAL